MLDIFSWGQSSSATLTPDAETFDYNEHNQLSGSDQGAVFTYNDNGHTETKTVDGVVTEYIYNHEERLIEVKVAGATVGRYGYNPYGQRVFKTVAGVRTWFLYNDEGMAGEYLSSGKLVKEYHFKPYATWMTEPLFVRSTAASGDAKTGVFYYQNDHLGTPQRLLDKSGAVVWQAQYSAFGLAEVSVSDVVSNLRFPGQYFDGESGLHWNRFRDYDPLLGRYVQADPIGMAAGRNYYAYVDSNPFRFFDPLGLNKDWTCSCSSGMGKTYVKDENGKHIGKYCPMKCSCQFNKGPQPKYPAGGTPEEFQEWGKKLNVWTTSEPEYKYEFTAPYKREETDGKSHLCPYQGLRPGKLSPEPYWDDFDVCSGQVILYNPMGV